jgi:hypothetical protein
MIEAKQVSKYTGYGLDYHICAALIKACKPPEIEGGVLRNWIINEIERASSISEHQEPLKINPAKVGKRLTGLYELNVVKRQKVGSNYRWFFNTGFTFDQLLESQDVKKAVIDIQPSKKLVITTVNAINPNKPQNKLVTNPVKSNSIFTSSLPKVEVVASAKLLNIVNKNNPRNPRFNYYFMRYRGLLKGKSVIQESQVIATPFQIYSTDHVKQIEKMILNESKTNVDEIQLILLNAI